MQFKPLRLRKAGYALAAAAVVAAFLLPVTRAHAQRGPFANLAGGWSGSGFITRANGQRERLRCRATYSVGGAGTQLSQNLRCASDSYRFDINSNVVSEGGMLSGNWDETSRNVSGSVSGRVSGGHILARVDGPQFSADLAISTNGNHQSVTIRSPGHDVTEVAITLTRSR